MAALGGPNIVEDGLVLYLDAANVESYQPGSTDWHDLSQSQLQGTLTNGPTFTNEYNGGIVFDGVNDEIRFGNPLELTDLPSGSSGACYSFWFKANSVDGLSSLFGKNGRSAAGTYCDIWDASIRVWLYGDPGTILNRVHTNSGSILPNTLYNFTFNYKVDSIKSTTFYLNGSIPDSYQENQSSPLSSTYVSDSTKNFIIGNNDNGGSRNFNGNIYNVSIYNRSLTEQEILQNYLAMKDRYL